MNILNKLICRSNLIIFISNMKLTKNHIDLLEEMNALAINVIETSGRTVDDFKIGFHAIPHMDRLHMHVISKDFQSRCLKTKVHWNSFNTEFFLSTECKLYIKSYIIYLYA